MNITVDKSKPLPQHRQVALQIVEMLKEGKIEQGSFLPGERTLAKRIGVTRDVIHRAYELLEKNNLIEFTSHIGHRLKKKCNLDIEETLKHD